MIEFIKASNLKAGDVLAKSVYSDDFKVLLNKGNTLTDFVIKQIQKLGYKGCYIDHAGTRRENIPITEPILDEEERIMFIKGIKNIFMNRRAFDEPYDSVFKTQRAFIELNIRELVKAIYKANKEGNFLYETEDYYRTLKNWIYHHSLNTVIISAGICANMDIDIDVAEDIAIGAVYHDYGKALWGEEFYNKPDLTDSEKTLMRAHTETAFRLFQKLQYPVNTTYTIWQHHEKIHGNGYPLGLEEDRITIGAKIVALASAFDNLVTVQAYDAKLLDQCDALEYLQGCDCYSIECMRALFTFIVPYPIGSKVILSNGKKGYVLKNVKSVIMRPYVLVDNELYDLANDRSKMDITIKECIID